jgi:long-chain acyl-CoA synthetase
LESVPSPNPKIEEAAVIGIKNVEYGQQVRAIVRLKKGEITIEQEIIDYCRPRLAGFKSPTSVVFVIQGLPKTDTGKILRRILRHKHVKPWGK